MVTADRILQTVQYLIFHFTILTVAKCNYLLVVEIGSDTTGNLYSRGASAISKKKVITKAASPGTKYQAMEGGCQ